MLNGPRVFHVPCHRICPVTYWHHPVPCVTLTVVTRVTHRLVQLYLSCSITCHVSLPKATTSVVRPYGLYNHPATWHCTDCIVTHFFACLGFRTERDIFRIRSPFDEVNIWPKSGRQDRRNGVGFVGFRALSFSSLFEPCQSSGSDSGSRASGDEYPSIHP